MVDINRVHLAFSGEKEKGKGKEKDLSEMGLLPPSARSSLSNTSNEVDPNSSTSNLQTPSTSSNQP